MLDRWRCMRVDFVFPPPGTKERVQFAGFLL